MEIKKLIDNISKEQYNWKLAMQMNDNYHIQQCEKNMEKLRTTLDTFRTELEMWKHRTYDFEVNYTLSFIIQFMFFFFFIVCFNYHLLHLLLFLLIMCQCM